MLIRDFDFLPNNWEWEVNSQNTNLEKIAFQLSLSLRKQYLLEKDVLAKSRYAVEISKRKQNLTNVDKKIGLVNVPIQFRSTKHFTINISLEVTGDYNLSSAYKNFTIIDNIDSFLTSGYVYSISYHDAYLDVAHENLPISKNAIVLIEESKYNEMIEDPLISNKLK